MALAEAFGTQHIKARTFRRWDINARMITEAHRRGSERPGTARTSSAGPRRDGRDADLLADTPNTRRIWQVVHYGRLVDRPATLKAVRPR